MKKHITTALLSISILTACNTSPEDVLTSITPPGLKSLGKNNSNDEVYRADIGEKYLKIKPKNGFSGNYHMCDRLYIDYKTTNDKTYNLITSYGAKKAYLLDYPAPDDNDIGTERKLSETKNSQYFAKKYVYNDDAMPNYSFIGLKLGMQKTEFLEKFGNVDRSAKVNASSIKALSEKLNLDMLPEYRNTIIPMLNSQGVEKVSSLMSSVLYKAKLEKYACDYRVGGIEACPTVTTQKIQGLCGLSSHFDFADRLVRFEVSRVVAFEENTLNDYATALQNKYGKADSSIISNDGLNLIWLKPESKKEFSKKGSLKALEESYDYITKVQNRQNFIEEFENITGSKLSVSLPPAPKSPNYHIAFNVQMECDKERGQCVIYSGSAPSYSSYELANAMFESDGAIWQKHYSKYGSLKQALLKWEIAAYLEDPNLLNKKPTGNTTIDI